MRKALLPIVAGGAILASPAHARDEQFELWLNPSFETDLDGNTGFELVAIGRVLPVRLDAQLILCRLALGTSCDNFSWCFRSKFQSSARSIG